MTFNINLRIRPVRRLLVLGSLMVAGAMAIGCESKPRISYSDPVAGDDTFERGVNRPPNAETLYRMARLLEAQGKDDQAFAVYMNTLDRFPDHLPSMCGLAALQVRQHKVEAGSNTLERALALSPNDPVILNDIGMCWMLRNDHERALEYFTKASAQSPDDARYKANMALATGMLGRYDEALGMYNQVMRPARAHYNVAVVAEARNDNDVADEHYARAHALDNTIVRKPKSRN